MSTPSPDAACDLTVIDAGAVPASGHGHDHGQVAAGHERLFAVVLSLTLGAVLTQAVGGLLTGSLALLADAGHGLVDSFGLVVALVAVALVRRPATDRRTWGFRRAEVLAAGAQAMLLLGVGVFILVEAVQRLIAPGEVAGTSMLVFAVVGLVANLAGMAVLAGSRGQTLTMRGAFLEVALDALGSVAVIAAAIVIATTGWERADAVASLVVFALIVPRTVALLRTVLGILLESTPAQLDLDAVRAHIRSRPHVRVIHDLHASTVASGLPILSAHVVVDDDCFTDGHLMTLLDEIQSCLDGHFDVAHSTIQFESMAHAAHEPAAHG